MRLCASAALKLAGALTTMRPVRVLAIAGVCAAALGAQPASAQTNVSSFFSKVEFSGLVDAYYTYNFNEPETGSFTPLRNFDVKHNQFSLSLLEFAMAKPAVKDDVVGFRFDLQYGQTAQIFNSDPLDNNNLLNVQQAYISYFAPVGGGLTFDVGKFATPIGTEATEAHLNNNYSRAFLYALGPYYHVGARASYALHSKVTLGAMLVNGWNATGDNNSGKSVHLMATIVPNSKVSIIQNFMYGPEQADNTADKRSYSDTNLAVTLSPKAAAGLNYVYAKDSIAGEDINWQGLALYFKGQLTPMFALSPRFEIFDDKDGFASGAAQNLKEFTMTAEVKHPQGLIFRAEYRRDWSDIEFFTKGDASRKDQNTFTVAFIVPFSSKS